VLLLFFLIITAPQVERNEVEVDRLACLTNLSVATQYSAVKV